MTGTVKAGIGEFVFLPKGTVVVNTVAPTGTLHRELVLKEDAIAIVDAADRRSSSFSVLLFRRAENKSFSREEVAFHTLVAQPLADFKTFATYEDAVKGL